MANTTPHVGQGWRSSIPFDWNNDCGNRAPRGDWFASGHDINVIFSMVWALNQRLTTLEQGNVVISNTNVTPQLQALTANLTTSSQALSNIIKAATRSSNTSVP